MSLKRKIIIISNPVSLCGHVGTVESSSMRPILKKIKKVKIRKNHLPLLIFSYFVHAQ